MFFHRLKPLCLDKYLLCPAALSYSLQNHSIPPRKQHTHKHHPLHFPNSQVFTMHASFALVALLAGPAALAYRLPTPQSAASLAISVPTPTTMLTPTVAVTESRPSLPMVTPSPVIDERDPGIFSVSINHSALHAAKSFFTHQIPSALRSEATHVASVLADAIL